MTRAPLVRLACFIIIVVRYFGINSLAPPPPPAALLMVFSSSASLLLILPLLGDDASQRAAHHDDGGASIGGASFLFPCGRALSCLVNKSETTHRRPVSS